MTHPPSVAEGVSDFKALQDLQSTKFAMQKGDSSLPRGIESCPQYSFSVFKWIWERGSSETRPAYVGAVSVPGFVVAYRSVLLSTAWPAPLAVPRFLRSSHRPGRLLQVVIHFLG